MWNFLSPHITKTKLTVYMFLERNFVTALYIEQKKIQLNPIIVVSNPIIALLTFKSILLPEILSHIYLKDLYFTLCKVNKFFSIVQACIILYIKHIARPIPHFLSRDLKLQHILLCLKRGHISIISSLVFNSNRYMPVTNNVIITHYDCCNFFFIIL